MWSLIKTCLSATASNMEEELSSVHSLSSQHKYFRMQAFQSLFTFLFHFSHKVPSSHASLAPVPGRNQWTPARNLASFHTLQLNNIEIIWLSHRGRVSQKKKVKELARKIVDVNDIKHILAPMFSDHVNVEQPESLHTRKKKNRYYNG